MVLTQTLPLLYPFTIRPIVVRILPWALQWGYVGTITSVLLFAKNKWILKTQLSDILIDYALFGILSNIGFNDTAQSWISLDLFFLS